MTVINESGLYSLVLSSKLPGAKKFKHWVTSEVLPSIRKTGHYTAQAMTDYQMESIRVRKAQLLERLAKEYDGTYRQVLQAHATKELTGGIPAPPALYRGKDLLSTGDRQKTGHLRKQGRDARQPEPPENEAVRGMGQ